MNKENNRVKITFRWIGVLPFAILMSLFGFILVKLNGSFSTNGLTISITDIFIYIVSNVASGYCFVWGGTLIAPYRKTTVAIVLTIIFTIFISFSIFLELSMHGFSKVFLGCIISLISACVACVREKNKELEETNEK